MYAGPAAEDVAVSAAGMPGVAFEVAWDGTNYVDVSGDLISFTVDRGRQVNEDRYRAGTLAVTLKNDQRQYDPAHSAGPWYGNIKPMRKVRLRATWEGVTYSLFTGFVDRWQQQPDGPNWNTVAVTATDAFKVLGRALLPSSAYVVEALADSPAHLYRLNEPEGSTLFYDTVSNRDLTVQNVFTTTASMVAREAGTAILTGSSDTGGITSLEQPAPATAITAEAMVRITTVSGTITGEVAYVGLSPDVSTGWTLDVNYNGGLYNARFGVLTTAGIVLVTGTTTLSNGAEYHVAGTWDGATARVYVNGVEEGSAAIGGTLFPAGQTTFMIVGGAELGAIVNTGLDQAKLQMVAVYRTALSAARLAAHASAVTTPWDNDTPGQRAARVLDAIAWSSTLRELDTGQSALQSAELDMSALDHLQKVAESEFGVLYTRADGVVRLEARLNLANQQDYGSFTDAIGSAPAIVAYLPDYGDDLIRNDVTVSRSEGVAQNVRDTASIGEYQTLSYVVDGLYHDSDALSLYAAQFILSEYKDPKQRITGLDMRPRSNPSVLYPQLLARELTDRVTVAYTPQGVGSQFSQTSVIEGIRHTGGPKSWETTWALSTALGGTGGCFLELDTGLCGLDTARLYF
jgi:hypothetical protein